MSRRERLEKLGNQPKKFTNVYIKNFGEDMTDEGFKELVDEFGKILSLKVVINDQGRSKGFGFVSFETPEEAQAVSWSWSLLAHLQAFRHVASHLMDSHFLGEYQIRGDLSDFQQLFHNILIEGKTSKYNWLSHYWKKGVKFQSILGGFFAEKTIYFAFKYVLSD